MNDSEAEGECSVMMVKYFWLDQWLSQYRNYFETMSFYPMNYIDFYTNLLETSFNM